MRYVGIGMSPAEIKRHLSARAVLGSQADSITAAVEELLKQVCGEIVELQAARPGERLLLTTVEAVAADIEAAVASSSVSREEFLHTDPADLEILLQQPDSEVIIEATVTAIRAALNAQFSLGFNKGRDQTRSEIASTRQPDDTSDSEAHVDLHTVRIETSLRVIAQAADIAAVVAEQQKGPKTREIARLIEEQIRNATFVISDTGLQG